MIVLCVRPDGVRSHSRSWPRWALAFFGYTILLRDMEDADGQVWMMDINVRVTRQALVTERSQDYLWLNTECFCCDVQ